MLDQNAPSVLLAGCGKMGGSLMRRWLSDNRFSDIYVLEPHSLPAEFANAPNIKAFQNVADVMAANVAPDIVILAVKPQIMLELCMALATFIPPETLVLSIAAGTKLALFEDSFAPAQPIVRTMPNTPAAIGQGAIVAVANAACTDTHKDLANTALNGTGLVEWVDDEGLMDAVTALSGSGPAYVFYLIEALEQAGTDIGLPADLSRKLARQTVIGAAALAESDANTPASTLRENVTSPGGTTAAALEVLMNGEFQEILTRALTAAKKRGEELGG